MTSPFRVPEPVKAAEKVTTAEETLIELRQAVVDVKDIEARIRAQEAMVVSVQADVKADRERLVFAQKRANDLHQRMAAELMAGR